MYTAPSHPWFEWPHWRVETPAEDILCHSQQRVRISDPDTIFHVRVRAVDNRWIVNCPDKPMPLVDLLNRADAKNWLLTIEAKDTIGLDDLIRDLAPFDKEFRFAIHSPAQQVARYLRKKSPQWLFAADSATLLRLHMFTSLWLETAFDFWPDFVIQNPDDRNTDLSPRELAEIRRRNKRVILLPNPR